MNVGSFKVSLNQTERLLSQLGFLKQKGVKDLCSTGVSAEFRTASQKKDYFEAYKIGLRNFDYDFLLFDESFLQFEFTGNEEHPECPTIRFAFFQNPQEYKSYTDFLIENELIDDGTSVEDVGDTWLEEYEQYALEQQINMSSITVRYDTDIPNYRPLLHSVSHIHIGHSNDIRIPCDKLISPEKFTLFILKHTYYYRWKTLIENKDNYLFSRLVACKPACSPLLKQYWTDPEKNELFFT